jgi:hypothetical protein
MLDSKFFFFIAPEIVSRYRKHIFFEGKDIDGKKFKKYSKKYSQRKKANKFKRQSTQFKDSTSPVLTSDLLRDFKMQKQPSSKGFTFGTTSWGVKVEALKKLGRNLYRGNKVLPTEVSRYFEKEAKKYTEKKLKLKFKGGTFKI